MSDSEPNASALWVRQYHRAKEKTDMCEFISLQQGVKLLSAFSIEGSRPEWCISSMIYSVDTPFWSETLAMVLLM